MEKYIINLDRRPDKWDYTVKEFKRIGVSKKDLIRFSAFDTKPGWIGCRDSHLAIMELCRDNKMFSIFEDDVLFLWNKNDTPMPAIFEIEDWDCVYLGASPREPQERFSENLFRLKNAYTTHAIIWNNRPNGAVEYILNHKNDIRKWDVYLAEIIQPNFNCFITSKLIATQKQFQSDTCTRSDVSTIEKNYNQYCK